MEEIRNELINLLHYVKAEDKQEKKIYLDMLLERFEIELNRQEEEHKRALQKIKENKELLKHIIEELKKGEK